VFIQLHFSISKGIFFRNISFFDLNFSQAGHYKNDFGNISRGGQREKENPKYQP
jgi:hypothetical protein